MKRNLLNTNITKEYIESKVSQELIFSTYLNIPLEVIQDCIENNNLIKSVFRNDDINNSMGFKYNKKGKLKVKDFGGFGFFEDVYGTVAYILSIMYKRTIDVNNKQDFIFILKHIRYTFRNIFDNTDCDYTIINKIKNNVNICKQKRAIIELVTRSWCSEDKKVWRTWGISLPYLDANFVLPVEQYYINRTPTDEPKYYYKPKDPCYAYLLGQSKTGIYLIKLYFPLRNKHTEHKFITNCNVLEGLLNLELNNYDFILITKSSKDRLSIGNHIQCNPLYRGDYKVNIGIINLPSENYKLKEKEYEFLSSKLKSNGKLISLFDFDTTGRCGAKYLKDTYNIPYLFITKGEFGLFNYKAKDFAELNEKFNKDAINTFVKDTFEYVITHYASPIEKGIPY